MVLEGLGLRVRSGKAGTARRSLFTGLSIAADLDPTAVEADAVTVAVELVFWSVFQHPGITSGILSTFHEGAQKYFSALHPQQWQQAKPKP